MAKRLAIGVSAAVLALGFGALALLRRGSAPEGTPAPGAAKQKERAAVPAASVPRTRFLGVIVTRQSVDLAAKLDGRIDSVRARLGDRVTRGASLATLDVGFMKRDLAMAEAALQASVAEEEKATLEQSEARDRLQRRRVSVDGQPVVTRDELSNATYQEKLSGPALQAARAHVAERRARVEQLRQTIDDAEIRAPFDGVVAARYVNGGATVTRGAPLVRLNSSDLLARFAVPEDQAARVSAGLPVRAEVEGAGMALIGAIEKVAPEVDSAARMVFVEARLDPPTGLDGGELILAGRVARVSVGAP